MGDKYVIKRADSATPEFLSDAAVWGTHATADTFDTEEQALEALAKCPEGTTGKVVHGVFFPD